MRYFPKKKVCEKVCEISQTKKFARSRKLKVSEMSKINPA